MRSAETRNGQSSLACLRLAIWAALKPGASARETRSVAVLCAIIYLLW
uniref:Uncharacterized protein n=1 Tax=Anguilla anguilla TaxID=7936 RepID=A0A0E9PJG3_ANGAN